MFKKIILFFFLSFTFFASAEIFDATNNHPNKPDVNFEKIVVVGVWDIWKQKINGEWPAPGVLSNKFGSIFDFEGGNISSEDVNYVCINIEHYKDDKGKILKGGKELADALIPIVKQFKEVYGERFKVGIYSMVPERAFWPATGIAHPKDLGRRQDYFDWYDRNKSMQRLVDEVDAIFPSLYTFYGLREQWQRYAFENIYQSRQFLGGKEVIPILMPTYHDKGDKALRNTPIEHDFFSMQIDFVLSMTNKVIIWSGPNYDWSNKEWVDKYLAKIEKSKQEYEDETQRNFLRKVIIYLQSLY